jgi:hypothetical protein
MPKKSDAVAFIRDLAQAANEIDQMTKMQCARLLQRAAAKLSRDYHYKIDYSGTPANSRWRGRPKYKWTEMPLLIDALSDQEISSELLHAISLIEGVRKVSAKPEGNA